MSNARGMKELRAFSLGKKLTLKQSFLAKCADCMGNYADGKLDCKIEECSLYPFMWYGGAWEGQGKENKVAIASKCCAFGTKKGKNGGIQ